MTATASAQPTTLADRLAACLDRVEVVGWHHIMEVPTPDATTDLAGLIEEVRELEQRFSESPPPPPKCQAKTCSYYTFYLALGPKDLEHEGYHAAEQHCFAAQQVFLDHLNDYCRSCERNPERCGTLRTLERAATRWEERIRV